MRENYEKKKEAFAAWQASKCSDEQLALAIKSTDECLETLRAMGDGGHFLMGLQMLRDGMDMAQSARKRDR